MKTLILAAGYGTRIQEVVKDTPKALIEVGGKTILDHFFNQLRQISQLNDFYLVTNNKFANQFSDWRDKTSIDIKILDNKTTSNEERLGAIGDLQLLIDSFNINDDILVCASDTIVQPRLAPFVESFNPSQQSRICVRTIDDIEDIKHRGVALVDGKNKIIDFEEKPKNPKSNLAAMPFYIYPKKVVPKIQEYLDSGGNPDAPGYFVAWLYTREPVYAHNIEGQVMDIGNPESLDRARKLFNTSSSRAE
jgi:glucose-1-phosphate thymidylyltransferase